MRIRCGAKELIRSVGHLKKLEFGPLPPEGSCAFSPFKRLAGRSPAVSPALRSNARGTPLAAALHRLADHVLVGVLVS
jgi:hypothetical protein